MSESVFTEPTAPAAIATPAVVVPTPAPPAIVENAQAKEEAGKPLTKEEKVQLKEYKLKVNGREKSVKFDPHNDEEVLKYLQKAEASDQKFKEASDVRNAALKFIDDLKKNPRKVLSDPNIGVDVRKFAEEIMNEALADAEKTPEQREKDALRKELEELKKQREDEMKSSQQKEQEFLRNKYEDEFTTQISTALDVTGLPKTARTVSQMAQLMFIASKEGVDLSFQDIAPIVKNSTTSEFQELVKSMSDDQLEDFMGKEMISRIRKRSIAKAKAASNIPSSTVKNVGVVAPKEEKQAVKKQTIREFLRV